MADGVDITAGVGTTVATDDCGDSGHAQIIKLAYSADGVATLITADADGLEVKVSNSAITVTAQPQRKTGAWHAVGDYAAAQTNTSLKAAPAGGTALYITGFIYNCDTAGTMKLLDGSGGSVLIELPGMAANGGACMFFGVETAIKLTDATALCITTTDSGNHTITVSGYTA